MKSINKLFSVLCALCLLLGLNACTDEVDYTPAEPQGSAQAYFPITLPSQVDLSADANSFSIELSRMEAGQELTVELSSSADADNSFMVPASATFAADSKVAKISIGFDPAKFELDIYKPLTVSIAQEDKANNYSGISYSFRAGIPAPYTTIGKVQYREDIVSTGYGFPNVVYEVELQENSITPGIYRLVNPYGKAFPYSNTGSYDTSKDYYLTIDARDPKGVYISYPAQYTGFDMGEGEIAITSYAGYMMGGGKTLEDAKALGVCGTLENDIITFPARSLLIAFKGSTSLYYASTGAFALAVKPGVAIKDYSATVSYKGQQVDIYNKHYAIADVKLGADVESAKVAIVEGYPEDEHISGILSGQIPSETVRSDGEVLLNCSGVGTHSIMVITYAEDKPQKVFYTTFWYTAGAAIPIDWYEGYWKIEGTIGKEDAVYLLSISKKDEKTLNVSGLLGIEGYDDTFELAYDKESGFVTFYPQQLPDLGKTKVLLVPLNTSTGDITDEETLLGQTNEYGEFKFENSPENEGNWNSIAVVGRTDEGLLLMAYFTPNLSPYSPQAKTAMSAHQFDFTSNSKVSVWTKPLKANKVFSFPVICCDKKDKRVLLSH